MISKINEKIIDVFSLKLKLSNIVCIILILSVTMLAILVLLFYHYAVYLGRPIPIWGAILVAPAVAILTHFSLVALRGLSRGVRGN